MVRRKLGGRREGQRKKGKERGREERGREEEGKRDEEREEGGRLEVGEGTGETKHFMFLIYALSSLLLFIQNLHYLLLHLGELTCLYSMLVSLQYVHVHVLYTCIL